MLFSFGTTTILDKEKLISNYLNSAQKFTLCHMLSVPEGLGNNITGK